MDNIEKIKYVIKNNDSSYIKKILQKVLIRTYNSMELIEVINKIMHGKLNILKKEDINNLINEFYSRKLIIRENQNKGEEEDEGEDKDRTMEERLIIMEKTILKLLKSGSIIIDEEDINKLILENNKKNTTKEYNNAFIIEYKGEKIIPKEYYKILKG